jgi:hypothetical protein
VEGEVDGGREGRSRKRLVGCFNSTSPLRSLKRADVSSTCHGSKHPALPTLALLSAACRGCRAASLTLIHTLSLRSHRIMVIRRLPLRPTRPKSRPRYMQFSLKR